MRVIERLSKGRDMDAEVGVVDRYPGPDARDQLRSIDNFSGAFSQRNQDIERAATQRNSLGAPLQQSCRRIQTERAKRDDGAARSAVSILPKLQLNPQRSALGTPCDECRRIPSTTHVSRVSRMDDAMMLTHRAWFGRPPSPRFQSLR